MKQQLRIAVSLIFALVAVGLAGLWVRSYSWRDSVHFPAPTHTIYLGTSWGRIRLAGFDRAQEDMFTGMRLAPWRIHSRQIDKPPSLQLVNTPLSDFGLGVAGSRDRYGVVAVIPLWLPVALTSIIAVAPWKVSRPQFSLRTLIIATTLIAIVLGMAVWISR